MTFDTYDPDKENLVQDNNELPKLPWPYRWVLEPRNLYGDTYWVLCVYGLFGETDRYLSVKFHRTEKRPSDETVAHEARRIVGLQRQYL